MPQPELQSLLAEGFRQGVECVWKEGLSSWSFGLLSSWSWGALLWPHFDPRPPTSSQDLECTLTAGACFHFSQYPDSIWSGRVRASERKSCSSRQSCPILCNPMDSSLPGSSVRGISQTRILEWVAISFSGGSSQPRDWTQVSCVADRFFTSEPLERKKQRKKSKTVWA